MLPFVYTSLNVEFVYEFLKKNKFLHQVKRFQSVFNQTFICCFCFNEFYHVWIHAHINTDCIHTHTPGVFGNKMRKTFSHKIILHVNYRDNAIRWRLIYNIQCGTVFKRVWKFPHSEKWSFNYLNLFFDEITDRWKLLIIIFCFLVCFYFLRKSDVCVREYQLIK